MRTYEEIQTEIVQATLVQDVDALLTLSTELSQINTSLARSSVENTLGVVNWVKNNYPTALEHYERALLIAEERDDQAFAATIRGNIANVYLDSGEYDQALSYLHEAATALDTIDDKEGLARVNNSAGIVHAILGDYAQALERFEQALALQTELNDRYGMAGSIGNMSHVYRSLGQFSDALAHGQRAMGILEDLGARNRMAIVHGMIGSLYEAIGDFPQALSHHQSALDLNTEFGIPLGRATALANLASVHTSMGDYDRALALYEQAQQINEEHGDRLAIATIYGNMGQVLYLTGDKANALGHTRRACALLKDIGVPSEYSLFMGNAITLLLELGEMDEARTLMQQQPPLDSLKHEVAARHHENEALLHEIEGDLDAAEASLQAGLDVLVDGMREREGILHQKLRDLALKRNDLPAYVKHNDAYQRITDEIRGKEATQKMTMMEAERNAQAERQEREKERALLYGALPESVATRMLRGESVSGDHFEGASVLFLDIVDFTDISDKIPPGHVVHLLEQIFTALDDVVERHGVTKIKTIGDSYMAVAGVPEPLDDHAQRAAACALDMLSTLKDLQITMPPELGDTSWVEDVGEINVRIGVHCGPVTAGVIGTKRLQYDVWGDTVNVASRMESTGEAGRIQVSSSFATALRDGERISDTGEDGPISDHRYPTLRERGAVEIKGKGQMQTYWLE